MQTGGGKPQPAHPCHFFSAGHTAMLKQISFHTPPLDFRGCEYSAISARKLKTNQPNPTLDRDIEQGARGNRAGFLCIKTPHFCRGLRGGAGSNRRHKDFQSFALPTELPHQIRISKTRIRGSKRKLNIPSRKWQLITVFTKNLIRMSFQLFPVETTVSQFFKGQPAAKRFRSS